MAEDLDAGTIAFAHRMVDLVPAGATGEPAGCVVTGRPALTNDKRGTLLILAAYHDHPDKAAALPAHGADPAGVDDRGRTAPAAAVFRQSRQTVTTLLEAGADPADGSPSALESAAFPDLPEMTELLRGA